MALGMIEVCGFVTSIVVADAAAKAADVKILALDKNKPAAGDAAEVPLIMIVKIGGEVSAVEQAVEAGVREAKARGLYVTHTSSGARRRTPKSSRSSARSAATASTSTTINQELKIHIKTTL